MFEPRRPAGTARLPSVSDGEARMTWRELIVQASQLANRVREGGRVDKIEGAIFARRVIRPNPFPLRQPSAQNAAEAFLVVARGFVASGWSESLAGFLAAGAACLDAMLTADGHARAAHSRRILGEED